MDNIEAWGRDAGSLQMVLDWAEASLRSGQLAAASHPPVATDSLPATQITHPNFHRNLAAWWGALPADCQQDFLALATWLAEETCLPEPGAVVEDPLDPYLLEEYECAGGATPRPAVVQETLDSLAYWKAVFVPDRAGEAPLPFLRKAAGRVKGMGMLSFMAGSFGWIARQTLKDAETQGQGETAVRGVQDAAQRKQTAYDQFRQTVVREGAQIGMTEYCKGIGLPDIMQHEELPAAQLERFVAHMVALTWLIHIVKALYVCEVVSRGRVMFDWGPKYICNRLACPTAQAYLAAQQPLEHPNVRLAFEAFAGKKLRKCSGCAQAWYCSKACQTARWKQHKPFCKALKEAALAAPSSSPAAPAVEDCTQALKLDPRMHKALARRCEAHQCLRKYDAALADLRDLYLQRPFEAGEHQDRKIRALRIRSGQIMHRRQAGQSAEERGFGGDIMWLQVADLDVPGARHTFVALSMQQCLAVVRDVGHELLAAATNDARSPLSLTEGSPGLLPWCLTYSLTDLPLKERADKLLAPNGQALRFEPEHDAWDEIERARLEVASQQVPCTMMCRFLANFMARCVGVPSSWLRDPSSTAVFFQMRQTCVEDRLAVLRRLCELWADPLVRASCGNTFATVISMLWRVFLGGAGITAPGEPKWDIVLTTPGFLAGLAGYMEYKSPHFGHIHTFLLSLPAERWLRVGDDQLPTIFLRCHAAYQENLPNMDSRGDPWPAEEYNKVRASMDSMLSTPERRFFVLTQLLQASRLAAYLAARAGLTRHANNDSRRPVLKPGVSASQCTRRLSEYIPKCSPDSVRDRIALRLD
ncbi:hypothetical protein WJX72_005274 [[Myrmecia] bisecta]|uniref:MYND-type domain-containing protein n=1 Tax=[Myrmecia] bisecta TaxID=41462 RepID=A0AAW1Q475_9CHLO